jgi:hypothetical protein
LQISLSLVSLTFPIISYDHVLSAVLIWKSGLCRSR